MFDGTELVPPLPPDSSTIGPDGQFIAFLLLCFLLTGCAYFFFEICGDLMSQEFWEDFRGMELRPWVKRLHASRKGKCWWQL
jgi:hypothetical protein